MTDISYASETSLPTPVVADRPPISTVINAESAILMPGTPSYETVWERMLRERDEEYDPPLDCLGRLKKKENLVAAKTGELTNPLTTYNPANDAPENKVILFRDHNLELPELHLRVCVLGPPEDTRGFAQLFSRAYCVGTNDITDADLVVFTGGPDVDPAYYDEKAIPAYYGDEDRDFADIAAYMTCYDAGIPMLGVCRGAQFLAVMNGGKLVQDLDGHKGDHHMWDRRNKEYLEKISSVHHQAVHSCPGMEILATSFDSSTKWLNPTTRIIKDEKKALFPPDIEAFYISDTCCIGIQGHPEYKGYHSFAKWTLKLLDELVILNPNIDWVEIDTDGHCRRRIKPDLLLERELLKISPKPKKPTLTLVPDKEI